MTRTERVREMAERMAEIDWSAKGNSKTWHEYKSMLLVNDLQSAVNEHIARFLPLAELAVTDMLNEATEAMLHVFAKEAGNTDLSDLEYLQERGLKD